MKKLILSASLLFFFNCNEDDNCDIGTIDENAVCIEIYDPVCGCDGMTYNNSCEAFNWNGVIAYSDGVCEDN